MCWTRRMPMILGPHMPLWSVSQSATPVEVTAWLEDMYRLHGATPALAAQIAFSARAAGGTALRLVLAAVKDNPEHHGVVMTGVRAAEQADAFESLVEDLADVILNPKSWAAAYFVNPLLDRMSAGINEENSQRRIDILAYKIRALPHDDRLLRRLRWQPYGSIAETPRSARDDRSRLLLSCLLHLLESAWAWTAASDLLDVLDRLPDSSLRQRLRAWILANAPDADQRLITDEIEQAISSRVPTGDDVALLDRAATDCDPSIYVPRWREAFGTAPDVEQADRALAADDVHEDWLRALQWVPLLPDEAAGAWATVCDILATRYGRPSREGLTRHPSDIAQYAVSPISAEQLRSLDLDAAAATVAAWRPRPEDWLGGVREIARTLESVVRDNIEDWVSAPIRTVENLRHPTYISHYLYALTAAASEYELPVGDLLDVIKLVRTRPWPVEPLADDHRDDSTDWRETEQAAVRLIKTLADSNRGFGDQADEAWAVLVSEASDRSMPSDLISNSTGPDLLTSAINRPCTRALEAMLSFLAYEYRSSETVRSEATALFKEGLQLPGTDGAEHRAVLASRIGFLLHVLPEWTKANRDLLFGSQAPEGLGQLTVEQAIEWSHPNPWLLENFREAVRNAIRSDAEHAMEHMIIAMLWECPGYSIQDTIAFLRTSPDLVSQSGHVLGYVLNDADRRPASRQNRRRLLEDDPEHRNRCSGRRIRISLRSRRHGHRSMGRPDTTDDQGRRRTRRLEPQDRRATRGLASDPHGSRCP